VAVPQDDIERILAIRKAIGEEIPLRIDANQGWSPEQAILVLNALGDANIQHCEEPIPRWQFMEMRRVKEASPIPIMADESCCDHHDAERLIGSWRVSALQYQARQERWALQGEEDHRPGGSRRHGGADRRLPGVAPGVDRSGTPGHDQ
jgi:hypothetical protein